MEVKVLKWKKKKSNSKNQIKNMLKGVIYNLTFFFPHITAKVALTLPCKD